MVVGHRFRVQQLLRAIRLSLRAAEPRSSAEMQCGCPVMGPDLQQIQWEMIINEHEVFDGFKMVLSMF
jgi:hypothetical protein